MEKKRTYKSKSGAEYELVQTKPPDATKKKKRRKAKGGKTYDKEIGGWVDPPSKNPAVRKLMSKRPKAKPSARNSSTKKRSQRARKSTSKRAANKSIEKSQKPAQLKMF